MSLDALVPYYGCKRQMADEISGRFRDSHAHWSLFCGSCAVELALTPRRQVVVNDLNGDVANLARVVASDAAPDLYDRLARTAFAEPLYREAVAVLAADATARILPPLERAYLYFLVGWQGRNGLVGTDGDLRSGFCKRFTSGGGDPATRFRNAVERLPAWWAKIRGWTVLSEDGIALAGRIEDKPGCGIYADPPYLDKTARYRFDFAGGAPLDPDPLVRKFGDHGRLARALARFRRTLVVVSYYDGPALAELYPADVWRKVPIAVRKNMTVASDAGESRAPEVLITNSLAV